MTALTRSLSLIAPLTRSPTREKTLSSARNNYRTFLRLPVRVGRRRHPGKGWGILRLRSGLEKTSLGASLVENREWRYMEQGFQGDPPLVIALVTCDSVTQSVGQDRKVTLVGLFDVLSSVRFPAALNMAIFVLLADVLEVCNLRSDIIQVSVPETVSVFGTSRVEPPENRRLVEVAITGGAIFPAPGRYEIRLYGNGTFLAHKPLYVDEITLSGGGNLPTRLRQYCSNLVSYFCKTRRLLRATSATCRRSSRRRRRWQTPW